MIYLGTLGRMIGIKCPSSQGVESASRYSFDTTLEGKVKAQARPIGRRTWSLQLSSATTPQDHSVLAQFANGAWGPGPFVFVSTDAPHTNLLMPSTASCDERSITYGYVLQAGPWQVAPGLWAANSYVNSSPSTVALPYGDRFYPAIPGVPVTASAYVLGEGARVGVVFYDANDAFISSSYSPVAGSGTDVTRSVITTVTPANAVRCAVVSSYTLRGAMPALTWTDSVQPWSDGQGCLKAVVSAFSRDQVLAVVGNTYSNVSFTVTEVG